MCSTKARWVPVATEIVALALIIRGRESLCIEGGLLGGIVKDGKMLHPAVEDLVRLACGDQAGGAFWHGTQVRGRAASLIKDSRPLLATPFRRAGRRAGTLTGWSFWGSKAHAASGSRQGGHSRRLSR